MGHWFDDIVSDFAVLVFQAQGLALVVVVWVALGGALGAVARFGFQTGVTKVMGETFPWGIFFANVLGCFFMGLIASYMLQKMPTQDVARLFLTTGFLGGFTTFSAFAFDAMKLVQGGQTSSALVYVFASVVVSIIAVFAGFALSRVLA
jgi:fluoride exporter